MTESEWLACADLKAMLKFLSRRASERKRRLFAAACCRRVWHLLEDERARHALEVAERYAEGEATRQELSAAEKEAHNAYRAVEEETEATCTAGRDVSPEAAEEAANAVCAAVEGDWDIAEVATSAAAAVAAAAARGVRRVVRKDEVLAQVALARCIFGNPFRPISVGPAWRTPIVLSLAQAAYGDLDPAHLGILADALEDAGGSADLLEHLRAPGPHARGCWVVDHILGRE